MSDTVPYAATRTLENPRALEIDIMFDRDISKPSEWHEELYYIRKANSKSDLVNFHVNSFGGRLDTLSVLHGELQKSPAQFHGILEGAAASAGSAIFLMCDTQEVMPLGSMMIHTSQMSYSGAANQMEDFGVAANRQARVFLETFYKDFMTQEEIERALDGKEFFFEADEVKERLKKRQEIRDKRQQEEDRKGFTAEQYAKEAIQNVIEDCEYYDMDFEEMIHKLSIEYARNTMDPETFEQFEKDINDAVAAAEAPNKVELVEKAVQEVPPVAPTMFAGNTSLEVMVDDAGEYVVIPVEAIDSEKFSNVKVYKNFLRDNDGSFDSIVESTFVTSFSEGTYDKFVRILAKLLNLRVDSRWKTETVAKKVQKCIDYIQNTL